MDAVAATRCLLLLLLLLLGVAAEAKLCPIIETSAENMRHVTLCLHVRRGGGEASENDL